MSKTKIFIDSELILDVLLEREEFFESSANILNLSELNEIKLFTSVIAITNIAYILRKELKNNKKVNEYINIILGITKALPVTEEIIINSMETDFNDFEDSIQYITAKTNGIKILLSRNKKDYKKAEIQILTPIEFLEIQKSI
jgi:predicted nucleic acid-binding protein